MDDREHEEGERWPACVCGPARRGLVLDGGVVEDQAVRHGVRELVGREIDVVFGERQFAVAGLWIRVCRCDGIQLGIFAAYAQDKHESVLPREARDFLERCTVGQCARDVHDVVAGDGASVLEDGEGKDGVREGM